MASPKQIVAITLLLGATGAVWVPQLLPGEEDQTDQVQQDVPAMLDATVVTTTMEETAAPAPPGATAEPVASAPPLPAPTDGSPRAGGELGQETHSLLSSIPAGLDSLESMRSMELSPSGPQPGGSANPGGEGETSPVTEEPYVDWIAVQEFLEANPVGGTLSTADEALALVGSRVVRVGDELAGGLLVVAAIEGEAVHYTFEGRTVRHELPPFRASASQNNSDASPSEAEASDEGTAPEAGPGSDEGAQAGQAQSISEILETAE